MSERTQDCYDRIEQADAGRFGGRVMAGVREAFRSSGISSTTTGQRSAHARGRGRSRSEQVGERRKRGLRTGDHAPTLCIWHAHSAVRFVAGLVTSRLLPMPASPWNRDQQDTLFTGPPAIFQESEFSADGPGKERRCARLYRSQRWSAEEELLHRVP